MNLPDGALAAFQDVQGSPHVVTIGNFDGVHVGHQHLIRQVLKDSRAYEARSLVVTFEPHPVAVLRPEHAPPRISTPEAKISLLHAAGIDDVATLPFDRALASVDPDSFLQMIVDQASPVSIIVGEGFRFGRMRAGSIETLRSIGQQCGFTAHEVAPLHDTDDVVSSSRVRASLASGDVAVAESLLGRRFRLTGDVEHGMARGRDLGYPTANLAVEPGYCIPADGIYVGYAHLEDQGSGPREALIYIGTSPTFGERERLVEVNILDYRGDLYSRSLEIEFLERVRADRKFDSAEALMTQMADDEAKSRGLLAGSTSEDGRKVSDGG